MQPIYITTAIDYVNGKPHVGHALEKIQADVTARYWRGKSREVRFLTGTDDNSLKNVRAAAKANQTTLEFVNENAGHFEKMAHDFNLSIDDFIRTTQARHIQGAQKFWAAFNPADIYQKMYRGLYCVGCEEFKLEKDLSDGKCPEHLTAPEVIEEENYFFRLSNYQDQLLKLIESDELKIEPVSRKNEMLNFIRGGLEDLSISRSVKRAEGWGVPVPGDPSQIMYVWVDALSNYIMALDYATDGELYQKYWVQDCTKVHMIGKGILRFHAVYWPIFLLSAGLPLPTLIQVHEYFTINNQKVSKSLGNVIDPKELIVRYGVDASRYLLLSALPYTNDGDISWDKLDAKYTADLANGLGNLLNRTLALRKKFGVEVEPGARPGCAESDQLTERYQFALALEEIWKLVAQADQQLERDAPWKETDEGKRTTTLVSVTRQIETIAKSLQAYMPTTAQEIFNQLETNVPTPLFPRLE